LGTLAVTYVDAIRSGAVPCMESAVLALAQMENSAAVGEAVAVYEEQLARRAALPTESVQELLELHAQCEREALRAFMARAFKDDDRSFQGELMRRLEEQKQEICRRNELASLDRRTATLLELSDELDDQIGQGVYLVPGGYQRFLDDQWHVVDRYWQVPGKGIKPVAMEEPMCLVGNGADGEQDGYKQGNNTVTSRAAIENEAALREALAHYAAGMGGLRLPAELGGRDVGAAAAGRAGRALGGAREVRGGRPAALHAALLQGRGAGVPEAAGGAGIMEQHANLLAENEAVSEQTCRALLEELSAAMQQKLSAGRYSAARRVLGLRQGPEPGGLPGECQQRGQEAEETLEQFLASKKAKAEAVLKADILLTEARSTWL
ncbi:unnamed protein product, partial [Lepidochelys olivacea]